MVKKKALKFWKRLTRREITEDYLSKNNNVLIEHLISLIGSKSELKKLYVQIFKKAYIGRNRSTEVARSFIQECRIAKLLLSHHKYCSSAHVKLRRPFSTLGLKYMGIPVSS